MSTTQVQLQKPITYDRADTCPICKAKRSIDAYNYVNRPIGLSKYLDDHNTTYLNQLGIQEMYCSSCKRHFFPVWYNNIPYAATQNQLSGFIDTFKYYKSVDP